MRFTLTPIPKAIFSPKESASRERENIIAAQSEMSIGARAGRTVLFVVPESPPIRKPETSYTLSGKSVFTVFIPAVRMLPIAMPIRVTVSLPAPAAELIAKMSRAVAYAPINAASGRCAVMNGKSAIAIITKKPAPAFIPMRFGAAIGLFIEA